MTQKCFPIEGPRQRIAPDRHFDDTHENDHGKRDDHGCKEEIVAPTTSMFIQSAVR